MVLGPGFVEHCWLRLFFGIPVAMKNMVNWGNGFAVGDANTKIVPENVSFSRIMRKAFLLLSSRQTFLLNGG